MARAVVLYASHIGHTEKVAEYIAESVRKHDMPCDLLPVHSVPEDFGAYEAAIVVGSVHSGHHAAELADAIRRHAEAFRDMYTAFCSVSLEAAVVENADTVPARAEAEIELHKPISHFLEDTGWQPQLIEPVAGALPYSHVGPFRRLLLKQLATDTGLTTDTSKDHVFTNWEALDGFVGAFCRRASVMPERL
ncbi:MAG: flavodoxin domain-containing protein [Myxococcota bacterium]